MKTKILLYSFLLSVFTSTILVFEIINVKYSKKLLVEQHHIKIVEYKELLYKENISKIDELIKYHKESYHDFSMIFKLDSVKGVKHVKDKIQFHTTKVNILYNTKEYLIWNYYKNNKND